MARPALPTNVHKLKGTAKKHPDRMRKRENEPEPNGPIGEPPEKLEDGVKACWVELIALAPKGVFGDSDRWSVEVAAELMHEFRESPRKMGASRMTLLNNLLGRFGMTPSDRTKIQVPKGDDKNPFDDD